MISNLLLLAGAFLCAVAPAAADQSGDYLRTQVLESGSARLEVQISPEAPAVPPDSVIKWVAEAAQALSNYYGRFPVKKVKIEINTGGRGRVGQGVSYFGRLIKIHLGRATREEDLRNDWELTHEMVHLSFPQLDDSYNWMEEGLATYVEPIARARIGLVSNEKYWKDLLWGLPKGLPQEGDQGLDRTHTWGRTYWGGALFWFMADLEIRERTQGKYSLHDVLETILDAGGNAMEEWDLDEILEVGDRATGTKVLKGLHDQMGERAVTTNLAAIFERLGVREQDGEVIFNDRAPLAALRHAMTR